MQIRLLLFLLMCIGQAALAQPPSSAFIVHDNFRESTLLGYVSLYNDNSNRLTIDKVINKADGVVNFKLVSDEILSLGFDPHHHWLKCNINNASSQSQNLVFGIDYYHIDDISFYLVDSSHTIVYRAEHLKRKTSIADRPIDVRSFAFPVFIKKINR